LTFLNFGLVVWKVGLDISNYDLVASKTSLYFSSFGLVFSKIWFSCLKVSLDA
jgi:hypothetical protein